MLHLRCRADSRSSEIAAPRTDRVLTYDPVRSGFLLPAALHLELVEQPAGLTELFSTLLGACPSNRACIRYPYHV